MVIGVLCLEGSLAGPFNRLTIVHSSSSSHKVLKAKVKLVPATDTGKDPVYGLLTLIETSQGVYINGKILGLEPGKHGFHVHQEGDIGNNCDNALGHFNPQLVSNEIFIFLFFQNLFLSPLLSRLITESPKISMNVMSVTLATLRLSRTRALRLLAFLTTSSLWSTET